MLRPPLFVLLTLTLALPAQAAECDFSAAIARTRSLMQAAGVSDGGIAIGTTRGLVVKQYLHDGAGQSAYDDSTRVAVASASKLLSGVRILQLIDQGRIDPDAPVSTYLPEFTGIKGTMTVRQMFSHTSGYGDDEDSAVLSFPVTLAQDVSWIANHVDMTFPPPGSWFAYGGIGMQVTGQVAQVQSGEDWQAGWIAHIGTPLGATGIDWQGLNPTQNYRIAGGARASLTDYAKVLAMLLGDGVGQGHRILSSAALSMLKTDQTGGAALGYSPPGADGRHAYSVGAWIETFPAAPAQPAISSIGKFGFSPWVDFDGGFFGVLMIEQRDTQLPTVGQLAHDAIVDIDASVRAALRSDCPLVDGYDAIFSDGVDGSD